MLLVSLDLVTQRSRQFVVFREHGIFKSLVDLGQVHLPINIGSSTLGRLANVVCRPFVGTFYRAPSPAADAFVEVGDEVSAGQVLCIVEAMKLMNEIEAETAGTIVEVLVDNGKPVEYGDRLFRIEAT